MTLIDPMVPNQRLLTVVNGPIKLQNLCKQSSILTGKLYRSNWKGELALLVSPTVFVELSGRDGPFPLSVLYCQGSLQARMPSGSIRARTGQVNNRR